MTIEEERTTLHAVQDNQRAVTGIARFAWLETSVDQQRGAPSPRGTSASPRPAPVRGTFPALSNGSATEPRADRAVASGSSPPPFSLRLGAPAPIGRAGLLALSSAFGIGSPRDV